MRALVSLTLLVVVAAVAARPEDGFYDSKYDNFDIKELISNLRLLKSYVQCFKGKGKCTAEGNEIKKWVPEAVQTDCSKCTDKQKPLVAQVIKAIMDQLPAEWEDLSKEYNPNGERTESLNVFLAKYLPK